MARLSCGLTFAKRYTRNGFRFLIIRYAWSYNNNRFLWLLSLELKNNRFLWFLSPALQTHAFFVVPKPGAKKNVFVGSYVF